MAIIQAQNISGNGVTVYSAWEPGEVMNTHSTITCIDGKWYGKVGTEVLPDEINRMPVDQPRFDAVAKWHTAKWEKAYSLIVAKYPDLADAQKAYGEIKETWG